MNGDRKLTVIYWMYYDVLDDSGWASQRFRELRKGGGSKGEGRKGGGESAIHGGCEEIYDTYPWDFWCS